MSFRKQIGAGILLLFLPVMLQAADVAVLQNGFEIRHEQRETIGDKTRLYLNADRSGGYVDVRTEDITGFERDESVREIPAQAQVGQTGSAKDKNPGQTLDVHEVVNAAGTTHALDPDFIASVIGAESSFNSRAVSRKGAQGLMQLMPDTASKLGVKDSFDVHENVDGGTRYLRELLLRYHDDVAKALAAYNAGPKRVDQYGGVPPYAETRQYVARIIRDYNRKKAAQKRNAPKHFSKQGMKQTASVPGGTSAGGS